jgi:DNA-binding MarR family transcriptional regulator
VNITLFAENVTELLPQIMRGLSHHENNYLTRGEISLPQFLVLEYLHRNGTSTMSGLADHLGISRAAATGLIDRMIGQKFVVRKDDAHDRRVVWIRISPKGKGTVESIKGQKMKTIIKVFDKISPKDREHYLNILKQMVTIIDSLPRS